MNFLELAKQLQLEKKEKKEKKASGTVKLDFDNCELTAKKVVDAQVTSTPPEVLELHRRWCARAYRGQSLDFQGRTILDLEQHLTPLFQTRPDAAQRAELMRIAAAVGISAPLLTAQS